MSIVSEIADAVFRLLAPTPRPKDERHGLLLISSGGIGDTILFSTIVPRFAALARAGEPITLIVRAECADTAFLFPSSIALLPVAYRRLLRDPVYRCRVGVRLRRQAFRIAISCDHLRLPTVDDFFIEAAATESFALVPRRWAKHDHRLKENRQLYTRWIEPSAGLAHRAVRWTELINGLTGGNRPPPMVQFAADRLPHATRRSRPYIVVHPFCSDKRRQHPVETYESVIKDLPVEFEVILSIGPGDLERNPTFAPLLNLPRVTADSSSLAGKASLVAGARLVVAVDTSIMHLAVGTGVPTLCLASAAHVIDSVPYDPRMTPPNAHFLYHDMPCRSCLGACIHPPEAGMFPCVARLDTDLVVRNVKRLLDK